MLQIFSPPKQREGEFHFTMLVFENIDVQIFHVIHLSVFSFKTSEFCALPRKVFPIPQLGEEKTAKDLNTYFSRVSVQMAKKHTQRGGKGYTIEISRLRRSHLREEGERPQHG